MGGVGATGIQGWLLVYVVCSIPVLLFFSAGLSGWFFDYPIGLWLAIFLVLASPLSLVLLRSSQAPRWNIAALWIASISITVRIVYGVLFQRIQDERRARAPPTSPADAASTDPASTRLFEVRQRQFAEASSTGSTRSSAPASWSVVRYSRPSGPCFTSRMRWLSSVSNGM